MSFDKSIHQYVFQFRTKCAVVSAKGTETIYYGKGERLDIEFDVYDRVPFIVFENNEFWDYDGPVILQEDAQICGANRTECSGVSRYWSRPQVKQY